MVIGRDKIYYFALFLAIAALGLCVISLSPATAQEAGTAQNQSPPVEQPADSASEAEPKDPNTPSPPSEQAEESPGDPNLPTQSSSASDKDEDSMLPVNNSMAELSEYFSRIFTDPFVTDAGQVDYAMLRRKRTDLMNAVRTLETLHPAVLMSLSREQRIAFWINTYNVCTLKLIIDNYPIQAKWYMILYPSNSIMQIPGAWDKVFFKVMGLEYTLKEMRNELLLDRYKDPRICFALSDAALGGAILRNEPIQTEKLQEQLDDQVRRYLKSPQGFRLDADNNIIYLSNVFVMNKDVFLASEYASILKFRARKPEERAWLNFLFKYLPPQEATYLDSHDVTIRFIDFNWTLNEK